MNRFLVTSFLLFSFTTASTAAQAAGNFNAPSFGFVQEMAGVVENGTVSANLYDSLTASRNDIRLGAFGGEVLIDPTLSSSNSTGIGYKYPFTANMAAYGKLYMDTTTGASYTNVTLGFSYTGSASSLLYNGNAEIFNCSACKGGQSESYVFLKAAGFFQPQQKAIAGASFGAEISMQTSPSPTSTDLFLGMRWHAKGNVLLDLGVMRNIGNVSTVATPAFVRLNVGF